jgi:hypothetical protein
MRRFDIQTAQFYITVLWNRTFGKYFKYDMYGVMIFGVRVTSKDFADRLKVDGEFSQMQKSEFNIHQTKNFYIFVPRRFV